MGGHATILGLQEFPTQFAGGLAMCPEGPGEMDFLTAVGAASERITRVTVSDAARDKILRGLSRSWANHLPTPIKDGIASIQIQLSGGLRPFASEILALRFTENVTAAAGVFTQPEWNPATRSSVGPYEGTIPFDGRIERPLMTLHGTGNSHHRFHSSNR